MKCPLCGSFDNKVTDSRVTKEGDAIRRRRECQECSNRFTTYEQVEILMPLVVKKDGRREMFSKKKLLSGIKKACEKRPISIATLEETVNNIEKYFFDRGEKEVSGQIIGARVMEELHRLDEVAYVRFASVYRSFKDISEFMKEIKGLLEKDDK